MFGEENGGRGLKLAHHFLCRASSTPPGRLLACVGLLLLLVTPDPARGQSVKTFPGEGLHAMLAFEDSWPQPSDMDANDVVIRYQVHVTLQGRRETTIPEMRFVFGVEALGTEQANGLALRLGISRSDLQNAWITRSDGSATPVKPLTHSGGDGTEDLIFVLYEDLRAAFPADSGDFVNTQPGQPIHQGESLDLSIVFKQPLSSASGVATAPYDIFIFRSANYAHQTHLPEFDHSASGGANLFGSEEDCSNQICTAPDGTAVDNSDRFYITRQGLPWAVAFPRASAWPQEGVPIDQAYPHLLTYIHSLGTLGGDWWKQGDSSQLFAPIVATPSLSRWAIGALMGALAGLGFLGLRRSYPLLSR